MEQILKYRNQIYGFLALWIVFFHIEGKVGPLVDVPILTPFVQMGNCGVDIFMFLSGVCLSLSLQRDENIKHFYVKRFRRVVISYLIVALPFFFWRSIAAYETHKILHFSTIYPPYHFGHRVFKPCGLWMQSSCFTC